jgi:endoplasmic reticulum-Golgi intermediate compartment protein 3
VWFFYETSPVHVEFQERRKGILPFITSVCAIVGGVFTVSALPRDAATAVLWS